MMVWYLMMLCLGQDSDAMASRVRAGIPVAFNALHWGILAGPFLATAGLEAMQHSQELAAHKEAVLLEDSAFKNMVEEVARACNLDPRQVNVRCAHHKGQAESTPVHAFYATLYISPDFISTYNFYQHWLMRFFFPTYAAENHERARFIIGRELSHIKNHDASKMLMTRLALPFLVHFLTRGISRNLPLIMRSGAQSCPGLVRLLLSQAKKIPVACGKLAGAWMAERYANAYSHYRADVKASQALGKDAFRAAIRSLEKQEKDARRDYAISYLGIMTQMAQHIEFYPFFKRCALDPHLRDLIRAVTGNSYFLWQQWSAIYALRSGYPSPVDRIQYLRKLVANLEHQRIHHPSSMKHHEMIWLCT